MDNELKQDDIQDKFLRDLLRENLTEEKAPDNFTKKTMNLVMQEWVNNPVEIESPKHGYKYWILLGFLIILSAAVFLATDTRKIITMSDIEWLKSFDQNYLVYIHSFFSSIAKSFLDIPIIVYVVIAGLLALFFADKLLQKTHSTYSFLFV